MFQKQRPTVPEVMPLVNAYYCFEDCGVGGCLHIVLDDDNIEDGNIEYCIECSRDPEFWGTRVYGGHDEAGELLGRLLLLMSMTQRGKLCRNHSGGNGPTDPIARHEFIARCRALLAKYQAADAVDPHAEVLESRPRA